MSKLSNPKETIAVVSQYDFDFRKRFGQNFLVDEGVILRALEAAQVGEEDVIFEIGPGIGTLTQYLCEAAHSVAAIEIDRKLIPILEDTLKKYDNVRIINEDVLKTDLLDLAREYEAGRMNQPGQKHLLKIVAEYRNNRRYKRELLKEECFRSHTVNDLFFMMLVLVNYI